MKQFTKHIAVALLLLASFAACKKDKGNYSYKDIVYPVIDTSVLTKNYSIEQYTRLTIDPPVKFSGSASQLSYKWTIYVKPTSSNSVQPPIPIGNLKKLDTVIREPAGNYIVEVVVKDTVTGITDNVTFNLVIQASIASGWMVLHTNGTTSDVDFLVSLNAVPGAPAEKRLKNIFSQSTGAPLDGTPVFISQTRSNFTAYNWITVGSTRGIYRMDGLSFAQQKKNDSLFRRPLAVMQPELHYYDGGSYESIINAGKLYLVNRTFQVAQDAIFSAPFTGDYYLAPFLANISGVSPSSSFVYGVIGYDQKNGRFVYTSSNTNSLNLFSFQPPAATTPAQPFDLTNIGKDMLYMERGYNGNTFAFFKDKTGNQRWLYLINFTKADDGMLSVGSYELTALPEIANAKFYQCGDLGPLVYYATDKTIYRYDYAGTGTASIAFNGIAAGESITAMRIWKPRSNNGLASTDNRLLYVATWTGTEGKLYEFSINPTSGAISPVPLKTWTGFGKITAMTTKFLGS